MTRPTEDDVRREFRAQEERDRRTRVRFLGAGIVVTGMALCPVFGVDPMVVVKGVVLLFMLEGWSRW